ncbi:retrovirus-related pol polyprotein from transposon TNT 1-94 [Tanacetum coccineum]
MSAKDEKIVGKSPIFIGQTGGVERISKKKTKNKAKTTKPDSEWKSRKKTKCSLDGSVDDMLIACKRKAEIGSTKSLLKKEFNMKELGEQKKILGIEIVRDRSRKILRMSQSGYVSKILNDFRIDNRKSVKMPSGGHFKLSLKDCPVRDYDVEMMSKVLYANAVGSLMYLVVFMRPDIVYAEAIWLRGLLEELGVELNTVAVNCDDQGAIHLSRNHVFHERTKHINVRYHFIRDVLEAKTVKVLKVGTEHNAADALTKVVPGRKLQHCLELLKVGVG